MIDKNRKQRLEITLPTELRDALKNRADQTGQTMAQVIRDAIGNQVIFNPKQQEIQVLLQTLGNEINNIKLGQFKSTLMMTELFMAVLKSIYIGEDDDETRAALIKDAVHKAASIAKEDRDLIDMIYNTDNIKKLLEEKEETDE